MGLRKIATPKQLFGLALVIALLALVACGSSATSTPVPADTAVPPTATAAPGDTQAPPTSTPRPDATATTAPVVTSPDVNPGKLIWMMAAWGNGRFDNIHGTSGGSNNYRRIVQTQQVAGDPARGALIPGIITKWEVSSDGFSWAFEFRDDIKFHDGSVGTMEDYLWTFQHNWSKLCLEKCTNIGNPNTTALVETIEQTGPNEITIGMNTIDSGFVFQQLSEFGPGTQGIHPARPLLYDTAQEDAYDANPISMGQMSLVDQISQERFSMERFEDYYYQPANGFPEDRRMKVQFLDMILVPEEATRAAALRAGDADIGTVSLQTKATVEAGGGRIIFGQEGVYWWVFFPHNWADPKHEFGSCCANIEPDFTTPFSNKNIRKALSYAMDKELMMERLYGGPEVAVAKGFSAITPSTIAYSPDLDPLPFDPDKARQLLADEGYPDGDGFGEVIVNTWVSTALPFLPESAQIAADFWRRELNLDVRVNVGDETSLKRAWSAGELRGQILWRDNETRVDAAGITRAVNAINHASLVMHQDEALFEQVRAGISVFDPATRDKALNDLYKVLWEEHYELAIGYVNIPWGVSSRILNWKPWSLAFYPSGHYTITLK